MLVRPVTLERWASSGARFVGCIDGEMGVRADLADDDERLGDEVVRAACNPGALGVFRCAGEPIWFTAAEEGLWRAAARRDEGALDAP